jgi:hypothetical protein
MRASPLQHHDREDTTMNIMSRLIDRSPVSEGLVEGGGTPDAGIEAVINAPAVKQDSGDPVIAQRLAELNDPKGSVLRDLAASGGSTSMSTALGLDETDEEAALQARETAAIMNSPEFRANVAAGEKLLDDDANSSAFERAVRMGQALDVAVDGFFADPVTGDVTVIDSEAEPYAQADAWGSLPPEVKVAAVESERLTVEEAQALDAAYLEAQRLRGEAHEQLRAEALLDAQGGVLYREVIEKYNVAEADRQQGLEEVIALVHELSGVDPWTMQPDDLAANVRAAIQWDLEMKQITADNEAKRAQIEDAQRSQVSSGYSINGQSTAEPIVINSKTPDFQRLLRAAQGLPTTRSTAAEVRAGILAAENDSISQGMAQFNALADKIVRKASRAR